MNITSIHVERFGCLSDLSLSFESGLNIIKGPNEAGKSTLQRAILMALFERTSKKKATAIWQTWGADRLFEITLELLDNDSCEWTLTKDFEENLMTLQGGGVQHSGYDAVQRQLTAILGVSSEDIFTSTAFIAQNAVADIANGRRDIGQQLETIVTGGSDDAQSQDVVRKLDQAVRHYGRGYRGRSVNAGPIARKISEQATLREQVNSLRVVREQYLQQSTQLQEVIERLQEVVTELQPRLAAKKLADNARILKQELLTLQEEEERLETNLENIASAEAALASAIDQLESLGAISKLNLTEVEKLTTLNAKVEFLREKPARPVPLPVAKQTPPNVRVGLPATLFLFSVLGVIASLYGFQNFATLESIMLLLSLICLLLTVVTGIWTVVAVIRKQRLQSKSATPVTVEPPRDDTEWQALEAELAQKLAQLGCTDWNEFERKYEAAELARRQRDRAQSQLDVLIPDGVSSNDLQDRRRDVSRQRRDVEEQLLEPSLAQAAEMDAVAYNRLAQEIDAYEQEQVKLQTQKSDLEYAVSSSRVDLEDLNTAEERLAAVSAEFARLDELLQVYELALQTLKAARSTTLVRASDLLAPRIGVLFSHLTGGRYDQVSVDGDLNITVAVPDASDTLVDPDRLSRGAQDQLYFAARIALCDLLFEDSAVPIFLDDPFVTFDADRRQTAIQLCHQIAQDRQVFLFTCSEHYDSYGHLINMARRQ